MKWTKFDVNDRSTFPKFGERVLAVDMEEESPIIDFSRFFGDALDTEDWSSPSGNISIPTHWMPMPELPYE